MEMRHPYESYVKLWEEIGGGDKPTLSAELASMHLKEYFIGKKSCNEGEKNRVVVVLIDEIDYLVTKKQTVLYDFFDWPLLSLEVGSKRRIITIGISNTLNLPERLHTRIQSRMGNKRIFFQSYNVDQSASILKAKIQQASPNYTVFTDEAILFAAKKTAALSGDIRKGFHICRTAADMVLNESHAKDETTSFMPVVRIKDVLKVSKEASNTAHSRTVALCQHFEVLLLLSLTVLAKSTGREFGGFGVEEITAKMHFIANEFGNTGYTPAPNIMETLTILSRLGEADIVQTTTPRNTSMSYRASTGGSGGAWPIVRINIDEHVFLQSLKGTDHYEIAQKYLVNSF